MCKAWFTALAVTIGGELSQIPRTVSSALSARPSCMSVCWDSTPPRIDTRPAACPSPLACITRAAGDGRSRWLSSPAPTARPRRTAVRLTPVRPLGGSFRVASIVESNAACIHRRDAALDMTNTALSELETSGSGARYVAALSKTAMSWHIDTTSTMSMRRMAVRGGRGDGATDTE